MRRIPHFLVWAAVTVVTALVAVPIPARPGRPVRRIVIIADGAGDFRIFSDKVRTAAREEGLPLEVVTYVWSHGYRKQMADQTDTVHLCRQGEALASRVLSELQSDPTARISLAGHSAGALVALTAARRLPPDSLHAVLLIGAAVSVDYEVRPVLQATRAGLHNFTSPKDRVTLGMLTRLLGNSDDLFERRAAGRYGFQAHGLADSLSGRLHEYPWQPEYARYGHKGGHFGAYSPGFLRAFLLPVFMSD
jgi:pimeloyl-ACP methyl ester carboxylesterase